MKKKTLCLCLIGLLAAAGLLTGCTRTSEELILSKENSATEEEIKTSLPENKDLDEVPLDEEETEREAAPVPEDGKAVSRSAYSVTLTDTVKYVESSRKEITRTEKRLSVVDENDPSTYQIVRKEEAVEVQNEIPCEKYRMRFHVSIRMKRVFRDMCGMTVTGMSMNTVAVTLHWMRIMKNWH